MPDWFAAEEEYDIEVAGESVTIRQLTADEYFDMIQTVSTKKGIDSKKYSGSLISMMVVKPEMTPEQIGRLKPGIKGRLVQKLEHELGLSQEAIKNAVSE